MNSAPPAVIKNNNLLTIPDARGSDKTTATSKAERAVREAIARSERAYREHLSPNVRVFELNVKQRDVIAALNDALGNVVSAHDNKSEIQAGRDDLSQHQESLAFVAQLLKHTANGSPQSGPTAQLIGSYEKEIAAHRAEGRDVELVVVRNRTVARQLKGSANDVVLRVSDPSHPEQPARFIAIDQYGKASAGESSLEVSPGEVIAAIDANHIDAVRRPEQVRVMVDVSGNKKLQALKMARFNESPALLDAVLPYFTSYAYEPNAQSPRQFDEVELRNWVGKTMVRQVTRQPSDSAADASLIAANRFQSYAGDATVNAVAAALEKVGGSGATQVTTMPIVHVDLAGQATPSALFSVSDPKSGEPRFVDTEGRIYKSFDAWKFEHQLPAGRIIAPQRGEVSLDVDGQARLESFESHNTTAREVARAAVGVAGVALLSVATAGTGTFALVAGAGGFAAANAFTAGTTIDKLRHGHEPTATDYLMTAGGALTAAGPLVRAAGAGLVATDNAARALNYASAGVSTSASVSSAYDLTTNWDTLTLAERQAHALNAVLSLGLARTQLQAARAPVSHFTRSPGLTTQLAVREGTALDGTIAQARQELKQSGHYWINVTHPEYGAFKVFPAGFTHVEQAAGESLPSLLRRATAIGTASGNKPVVIAGQLKKSNSAFVASLDNRKITLPEITLPDGVDSAPILKELNFNLVLSRAPSYLPLQ